jgi:uncharacterized protein
MPDRTKSQILEALYRGDDAEAHRLAAAVGPLDVFEAAALGDADVLRALFQQDPMRAREAGEDGFTPLHLAAFFGTPECVVVLLAAGADPAIAARNAMLVTPLHSAVSRRKAENVRALLGAGVPVDARQQGGLTALHAAAHNGDQSIVDMLLAHGADRTIVDANGKSAAQHARDGSHIAIVALLDS